MYMKQKVVIIGHGYTSRLGIIRSLAVLDCEITVVVMVLQNWWGRLIRLNFGKPVDCHSRYVQHMYYCPAKDGDRLINLLLEKCTDPHQKVVVIPDTDFSAMVIDNNQERLSEHFLFPHINHEQGAVARWMDKDMQKTLARDVGLNVAKSKIVNILDGRYDIPDDIEYPCFTKPVITIVGGKQYFKRCNTKEDLSRLLDFASRENNIAILVEDFKDITTEYAVLGFSDGYNVVIPGIIEFIANSKSHFGIAREGKVMPVEGFEGLLELFTEFVRHMGFCGLFDIDFFESGGKLYFSEMNLRFGGSGYAITKMGVNLPAMMVNYLSGNSYDVFPKSITTIATYVNERVCIDDWCYNYISEFDRQKIINSRDIKFVYDEDDPGPSYKLERNIKLLRIKRVLKRWLKK